MIRIICKIAETCPEGVVVQEDIRSFEVVSNELENFLRERTTYVNRSVIGVELVPPYEDPHLLKIPNWSVREENER
jgi:hypothetical protein